MPPHSVPTERIVTKIIFPTADLARSVAFYRGLGFEVEQFDASYAWVSHRGDEVLHLSAADGLDPAANRAAGYFHVQDADAWHRAWTASAVAGLGPIVDQPWGMREFEVRDPDRNLLRVGRNR